MPLHWSSRRRFLLRVGGPLLALTGLFFASCPHDTTILNPTPPDSTNGGGGGGTVQRATFTLTVTLSGEDSALAHLIGSGGGVLRDAEVRIARTGSESSERTDTTGADGVATFTGLLAGSYSVSAIRLLTAAEIRQLGPASADVNAFGGGATIVVSAPTTQERLAAAAGRRGSLVISEQFRGIPHIGTQPHYLSEFLEVYNNSDTTIYLDGKLIVQGPPFNRDIPPDYPCDSMAQWQLDPEGIWTRFTERFPGTGRDYPLPPGQAAVVATDAIDHRIVLPWLPDLSGADFEFIGSNDVDNPTVPNMQTVLAEPLSILGHGMTFYGNSAAILALADAVDIATLPQTTFMGFSQPFYRIPAERVLDVTMVTATPALEASVWERLPLCARMIDDRFDTQPAALDDAASEYSVARRILGIVHGGYVVLQRTRNSARDLEARFPHTPSTVP